MARPKLEESQKVKPISITLSGEAHDYAKATGEPSNYINKLILKDMNNKKIIRKKSPNSLGKPKSKL